MAASQVSAVPWWRAGGAPVPLAAYQPKGAASLALSYVDLSGNGNHVGVGVAPTWDAVSGWIFNGTTQYLTTGFVPNVDGTQSVIVQFTNNPITGSSFLCGSLGGGTRNDFGIRINLSGNIVFYNGGNAAGVGNVVAGNYCLAGNLGYKDGVAVTGAIPVWIGSSVLPLFIGAGNVGGSAGFFTSARIQALAVYDVTLTGPQVVAVSAAMAAL